MKKIIFITSLIAITFSSCDKPTQTDLTINFTHKVDGSDLITNSMIYTNSAGENYDVKTLKYLISDINLHSDDGNTLLLDEVHFIDISDASTFSFTVEDVPNNNYTSISYTMGLDTIKNINNLYINESYHSAMAWPETNGGGYHYMKLEGAYNNDSTFYNTHTGGTMGSDYSFNNVEDISLTVDDDLEDVSINVNMEINNWYNSPNQIEFSSYGMGIMMNMMMQMNIQMNGTTDVFSVTVDK
ncbi:MAG: hypothetical protein HN702_01765 [Flavobacteriales bacterium]|jgi:hypothetical protein|nr:hypothetical protein [Flavobacteriales bacterium]